ncbi:dihydrofolate reductase [uncultured Oscillibacter sp.]|uniref:dihydrofolate reductase n=1 Tax=uncultured Oscillibacter sp. TaxID=876091 RepID=UPI002626975E|nr:dihydrofolate reductase [uncultured Oscillibacter sp.]
MNAIVITDRRWAIGRDGGLLFSLPTDMRHFRDRTMGGTVILGRRTLDSFPGGRPLPGRRNIVVTHQADLSQEGMETAASLDEAVALAGEDGENVWVIGGGSVYTALLNRCRRVVLTRVDAQAEGADTFFPNLDKLPNWTLVSTGEPMEENGLTFRFLEYVNTRLNG